MPFSISSDGIVLNLSNGSANGIMSKDKSLIVATATDGTGSYLLGFMLKSGGSFVTSDLQGMWTAHMITTGIDPSYIGWLYGASSIDASGNWTWIAVTRSNGDSTLPVSAILTISPSGIITIGSIPSFHGVMSLDKSLIVATVDDGGGGGNLIVLQKEGGVTFAQSDLQGEWNGWAYGWNSTDASGNQTFTSTMRSDGNSTLANGGTLSLSTAGVLTQPDNPSAWFNGSMSSSKSLAIATMNDDGGGYDLIVLIK